MTGNQQEMQRLRESLETFAVEGQRQIVRWIHTGTVRSFGQSPGTPVKTREARSGGRIALNAKPTYKPTKGQPYYSLPGAQVIESVLRQSTLGDRIVWRNRVEHAGVLEGGRRFSSRLGRMVGSKQARHGFLRLSIAESRERLRSWKFRPEGGGR